MDHVATNEKHTDLISFVLAKFWLAMSLALRLWIDGKTILQIFHELIKMLFKVVTHLSKAVGFDLKTHPKLIFECSIFQVTLI